MNPFMVMEPTNQSFQELFSNGVKYRVPRFQRDYAWGQEQWEDLWSDIETLAEEHFHYMGYIVLQRKGVHDFEVIDGQQRLVTASLIVLSAMYKIQNMIDQGIEQENNQARLDELGRRFIGTKDLVSLKVSSKLSLNRNNNRYYQSICTNLQCENMRGLTSTNRLLKKTFEFFIQKYMGENGGRIAAFVEQVTSGMVFTKIVVQDNLNAYKVFETLNARGVQLSTPDLLKNYIFSSITSQDDVSDGALNDLDEDWSWIVSQLGDNNFTDFTRYHHNFQKKLVTKKDLFKSIRELADSPKKSYDYIRSLKKCAPIYGSLLNPNDEWWRDQNDGYREISHYLEGLSLFNIKQPFTILMVAFLNFKKDEFVKVLKYMYILSIRYNVICHLSPNEQEKRYNQIAMDIYHGKHQRASHVKNSDEFKYLYPDDDTLKNAFEFHRMPSRQSSKKIRFLLADIEKHLGYTVDYLKTTLEHICPYHPEQGWHVSFGEGASDVYDRLGNMLLLEKDELKRASFEEKKKFYATTAHPLALKITAYPEWNLRATNDYQAWLADQAVQTWRVE